MIVIAQLRKKLGIFGASAAGNRFIIPAFWNTTRHLGSFVLNWNGTYLAGEWR